MPLHRSDASPDTPITRAEIEARLRQTEAMLEAWAGCPAAKRNFTIDVAALRMLLDAHTPNRRKERAP